MRNRFFEAEFLAGTVDQAIGAGGDLPVFGECLKHCILIVEDNLLNASCSVTGSKWRATKSGLRRLESQYEVFSKRLPDAVLLDINPFRKRPRPPRLDAPKPKCARSRDCRDGPRLVTEREVILQAGCRACLSKPIDFQLLQKELTAGCKARKRS